MGNHWEVRMGALIAGGGMVWTAYLATLNYKGLDSFSFVNLPRGPLEICAVGILVWLHAKWRSSVVAR